MLLRSSTNDRSTYSNVAFSPLGQVLERVTEKSYSEIIVSSILEPLGMDHTSISKPKDSLGIIPRGENLWGVDLGADTPTGGLYSTANDLSKYVQSILTSKLLPRATTNVWMKPHSWTDGANTAYGMPWEIFRSTKLTRDGRGIDIITRGGSVPGYYSLVAIIPEFGIGVTILVAGDSPAVRGLRDKLIATLIPAVEELLRNEAKAQYAGSWVYWQDASQPPDPNWSLKLDVDEVGPGIRILDWVSNGTNFLDVYGWLKGLKKDSSKWQARLIPTGVFSQSVDGKYGTANWRLGAYRDRGLEDEGKAFDDFCTADVDNLMYGGLPPEGFTMRKEENKAVKVSIPALRVELLRFDNDDVPEKAHQGTKLRAPEDSFGQGNNRQEHLLFE